MPQNASLNSQNRYEIKVFGQIDDFLQDWFSEAEIRSETLADGVKMTIFSNIVMDQAGLVGLVRRLHGMGIVLISFQRVDIKHDRHPPT